MLCQKACHCNAQLGFCLQSRALFSKKYEYCDYHEITTCLQILEAFVCIVTNQDIEFGIWYEAYGFFCVEVEGSGSGSGSGIMCYLVCFQKDPLP